MTQRNKSENNTHLLREVIDPEDFVGTKNRYIDLVQKAAIDHNLSLNGGERLVDFGCGNGRFTSWLAEKTASVVGIDIDDRLLKQAREYRRLPNVEFVQFNGIDIPIHSESIDVTLSVGVLQTISDRELFVSIVGELSRITKREGIVFAIEQVSRNPEDGRRTPEEYVGTFRHYGFSSIINRPIRGGRSLFVKAVSHHIIPEFLLNTFARLESRISRFNKTPSRGYHDQMMIFSKG